MAVVCGLDFVEAVCDNVFMMSHAEATRLEYSRGNDDFKRGRRQERDKAGRSAGRAGSANREDRHEECLCCGS